MIAQVLSDNWQLRQRSPRATLEEDLASHKGWIPATVPGYVHQDLMREGVIPDPFVGLAELEVQWVGDADWLYRCTFEVDDELLRMPYVDLCCDGLDTFATVWLNGQEVLHSDNQFVPHRAAVREILRAGSNELWILFESPLRAGRRLQEQHGEMRAWNGDPSRVYVRKAGYHYGWDWGPTLLAIGPWREIRLEGYSARIDTVRILHEVAPDLSSAAVRLHLGLEGDLEGREVLVRLLDPEGHPAHTDLIVARNHIEHEFDLQFPHLWWPRGHGPQQLYTLQVSVREGEATLASRTLRTGFRRLRLLQEPVEGEEGSSFTFEINNVPLFCGGYNWIPADSFTTRVDRRRYERWLRLAAEGNATMLRVWGGGIYEADAFYELCDELGLLVWQDFMFACGMYPAHEEFLQSVRREAESAITRLHAHPSIVIWCGNNEDYQVAQSIGAYDPDISPEEAQDTFPGRMIYERVLPEVCARLDPSRPYWPGSPYAGADPNDPTQGDRHVWEVWHGQLAPYQRYPSYRSRFVSEFGMQALPSRRTIEAFAPPSERYPESRTLDHHNKAQDGPRRIAVYLSDNLRAPCGLAEAVYATQLVQAEALAAGIRGWRREWRGRGRYGCSGALVWQLNDCWPVTSWAVADYYLRPKAAYYVVRRELAPITIGYSREGSRLQLWCSNLTGEPFSGQLEVTQWSLQGEKILQTSLEVNAPAYGSVELGEVHVHAFRTTVVGLRLLAGGSVIARAASWPEPLKYLHLPKGGLDVAVDGQRLRLRATRPLKGVLLEAEGDVTWSDNALDLLPGDEQVVVAEGLEGEIQVRYLGDTWD